MTIVANLTIKKNDGTTDIVWTANNGQGGSTYPASYSSATVGSALAHQPTMTILAKDSGDGETRRTNFQVVYPNLVTDTASNTTVQRKGQVDISFAMPKNMTATQWNECVSQSINLLSALKVDLKAGTSPT